MTTARQLLESSLARINWIRAVDKFCVEQMIVEQSNFEQFTPTLSNLPMKDVTNFRVRGVVEKVTLLLLDTLDNGLVEILEIQTSVVAPGPRCDQGHRLVEQHLESRSRRLHPEVDVTQHVLNATVNNKQTTFLKFLLYANFDRDS